ncbi:MAG: Cell cycle checkpoint protein rad17 [Thelocarpon impressellum]|nr:MAG: Cell cycle checkpoint protein rad17 [Thelocarpon impressellum]
MAERPAKRQKRHVAPTSSENEEVRAREGGDATSSTTANRPPQPAEARGPQAARGRPAPKHPRGGIRSKPRNPRRPPSNASQSSPEKPKGRGSKGREETNNGSIYTFFTATTKRQQTKRSGRLPSAEAPEVEEDQIQDDSHDEGLPDAKPSRVTTDNAGAVGNDQPGPIKQEPANPPRASQKFVKRVTQKREGESHTVSPPSIPDGEEERLPWAERYAPTCLDELAVHRKKVADVRTWLENAIGGRDRKRVLVLKGAAGTGKTTTVSLLSKAMNFDVLEWRNPVGSVYATEGYSSASAQFEEFLGRGAKFGGLEMAGVDGSPRLEQLETPSASPTSGRKKIILIEEFPNTYARASSASQSFRTTLRNYLASTTPSPRTLFTRDVPTPASLPPVVMVISETLLTTSTAAADSFTAHRLLGPEVLNHPGVTVMEFNPVARTILAKALDLVIQKEARESGRRKAPGPSVLEKLGEVGDVRSAVGSLEFLCLRGDADGDWGAVVPAGKAKRGSKEPTRMTEMERESLEMVTQREATLGIFHAVAKVAYNKRDEGSASGQLAEAEAEMPEHLHRHVRTKPSQVRVDELIDEMGTDTQTFVAALHENYVLSCSGPSSDDFLNATNGCIEGLSDSDLLCRGGYASGGRGGPMGVDSLRQDEMSFQVAVRSMLFALPEPVKRIAPPVGVQGGTRKGSGGRGDAFKMFYPTSLRIWREAEEIESIVDLWAKRTTEPGNSTASPASGPLAVKANGGVVESWKGNFQNGSADLDSGVPSSSAEGSVEREPSSRGGAARREMILERLPYMAKLDRARGRPSAARRQLEKATTFQGIDSQSEDVPDEDRELPQASEWATDRASESGSPVRQRKKPRRETEEKGASLSGSWLSEEKESMARLVLSDDDIEDD